MATALLLAVLVAGYYGGMGWLLGGAIEFRIGCVLAAITVWGAVPVLDRSEATHPSR